MYEKKYIGMIGEEIACKYLLKNKYKILDRNFSCKQGEIDIICYDIKQKEIVFVEVKTRTNFSYGLPSDSVNKLKRIHIRKCIEYYLYKKKYEKIYIRVDVIEIVLNNGKYKLNHMKNIDL